MQRCRFGSLCKAPGRGLSACLRVWVEGALSDGGCKQGRRGGETVPEGPEYANEGANEDSQVRMGQSRDSRSP